MAKGEENQTSDLHSGLDKLGKYEEITLAIWITCHPAEFWSSQIELAQQLITRESSFDYLIEWTGGAVYFEFLMDQFRPEEKRRLKDVHYEGDHVPYIANAATHLYSSGMWNLEDAPDVPDPFVDQACQVKKHPLVYIFLCFTTFAFGRVAMKEYIRRMEEAPKVPLLNDVIAYLLAKNPPKGMEDEIWWDGSIPHQRIVKRDFSHYQGSTDQHGIPWTTDKQEAGQTGVFEALEKWSKESFDRLFKASSYLAKSFQATINNKLADLQRDEHPELNKRWRKALRDNPPQNEIEKTALREKVEDEYQVLSLEAMEDTHGSLLDLIQADTGNLEEIDHRRTLEALAKAKLPERQNLVIDLTLKGKGDEEIALALKKRFGKKSSMTGVRKLRHDAHKRLKRMRSTDKQ